MKRWCTRCGKFHDINDRCNKGNADSRYEIDIRKLRSSYRWTKKSEEIRARDNYLCVICREQGRLNYKGLSVHHIVPLEYDKDKAFDDDNLVTLCERHHEEAESGKIDRAYLLKIVEKINSESPVV